MFMCKHRHLSSDPQNLLDPKELEPVSTSFVLGPEEDVGRQSPEVAPGRTVDRMRNSRLSQLSTWQRQMNQEVW